MNRKYNHSLLKISSSDFIIVFGIFLDNTNLKLNDSIKEVIDKKRASVVYLNPVDNKKLECETSLNIKYEVGSEEGICALFLEYFVSKSSSYVREFIDDLDIGYLSAESSFGEEEFLNIVNLSKNKKNKRLVVGYDLFMHERALNIAKLLGVLNKYSDFDIVLPDNLDTKYLNLIEDYNNEVLQDIGELKAYDGTIMYNYAQSNTNKLIGGASFSKIAKIEDNDKIIIKYGNNSIKSIFKQDPKIHGTIALNVLNKKDPNGDVLNSSYGYKSIKIQKVDENNE